MNVSQLKDKLQQAIKELEQLDPELEIEADNMQNGEGDSGVQLLTDLNLYIDPGQQDPEDPYAPSIIFDIHYV